MIRGDVAINDERVKLLAGFINAVGLGLIGVGVLAPVIGYLNAPSSAPIASVQALDVPLSLTCFVIGMARRTMF